ncbi:MAG: hypothetical protein EOO15_02785 [Chitinophagaceae bacterium]|nr:MAG: hypothetical protein EOO15_02785 [Chitinophagaceae bacterium]
MSEEIGDHDLEAVAADSADLNGSLKKPVVLELFKKFKPHEPIYSHDITAAMEATKAKLGRANPANFLKDIIRKRNANSNWPTQLISNRMSARQRYGNKRVMEFVPFAPGQTVPFPDRFDPLLETPVVEMQSISIPYLARTLGRAEETWITQVVVNLKIIETALALHSPLASRIRDVTHLQIGMKTKPEIDATYVLSLSAAKTGKSAGKEENLLLTCEAKQKDERILEDQIKEQVAKAFETTRTLKEPGIDGIKPFAIQIWRGDKSSSHYNDAKLYVVEFEHISRDDFDANWRNISANASKGIAANEQRIYDLPLVRVGSGVFFRVRPAVKGINAS